MRQEAHNELYSTRQSKNIFETQSLEIDTSSHLSLMITTNYKEYPTFRYSDYPGFCHYETWVTVRIIALDSYIQLWKSHPREENQLILCVAMVCFVLLFQTVKCLWLIIFVISLPRENALHTIHFLLLFCNNRVKDLLPGVICKH